MAGGAPTNSAHTDFSDVDARVIRAALIPVFNPEALGEYGKIRVKRPISGLPG